MATKSRQSVDESEIARFAETAALWWDAHGPYRPLHRLNPARLDYIRSALLRHFGGNPAAMQPLSGLRILDVGCGGGLIAEPLARMGATVTGLDAGDDSIGVARAHAAESGLDIDYRAATVEALAEAGETFDAVLALEVVEHVADIPGFLEACRAVTAEGGAFVFSTLNRTARSFALGIVAAEYVLGWVPRGTHDWRKFLTPGEMTAHLAAAGFDVRDISGLGYDPLRDVWSVSRDTAVNYIGTAVLGPTPQA